MKLVDIARICHEADRAYCLTLGDSGQPPWDEALEWQRDSALKGVRFHLARPTSSPRESHESWLKVKQADGWVYGPVKDAKAKTHPCCVPYDQLPAEQKAKDYLFLGICRALEPFVDFGEWQ